MPTPTFAPPDVAFTRPFWEGVAAGELRLPRCPTCGTWDWYPQPDVSHCPGAPAEWIPVAPTGTIYTFTTVRRPFLPGATREDMPFVTVLVELDDAPGVRLVATLRDGVEPRVGLPVTAAFPERDGRRTLEFEPSRSERGN